ncbi:hypothetical protein JOF53_007154 [Crossiella equi]|uniref:Uncharacterized protein n=1 Tax=Crossiella equi TaxID=130796 RepID=A0ABS5ANZ2_9PSEU|nr:hypothetical protein [Crossiella equi]MBP2478282.1 hypothetical protein [Crossiella equi]
MVDSDRRDEAVRRLAAGDGPATAGWLLGRDTPDPGTGDALTRALSDGLTVLCGPARAELLPRVVRALVCSGETVLLAAPTRAAAERLRTRAVAGPRAAVAGLAERLEALREGLRAHENHRWAGRRLATAHEQEDQALLWCARTAEQVRWAREREPWVRDRLHHLSRLPGWLAAPLGRGRLREELAHLHGGWTAWQEDAHRAAGAMAQSRAAVTRERQALAEALAALAGLAPPELLRREAKELGQRLAEAEDRLAEVADRLRVTDLDEAVLRPPGTADAVVLAEADRVDLPSAWCAAALARHRVVLSGEPGAWLAAGSFQPYRVAG